MISGPVRDYPSKSAPMATSAITADTLFAVQDELCRSRKNKPLPGLTVITEMMDAQGELR